MLSKVQYNDYVNLYNTTKAAAEIKAREDFPLPQIDFPSFDIETDWIDLNSILVAETATKYQATQSLNTAKYHARVDSYVYDVMLNARRTLEWDTALELFPEAFPGIRLILNEFAILCGQTGFGKSSMAYQIAASLILRKNRVCFIALESRTDSGRTTVRDFIKALKPDCCDTQVTTLMKEYFILIDGQQEGWDNWEKAVDCIVEAADPLEHALIIVDNLDNMTNYTAKDKFDKQQIFDILNNKIPMAIQNRIYKNHLPRTPVLFLKQVRDPNFTPQSLANLPALVTNSKQLCNAATTVLWYHRMDCRTKDAKNKPDMNCSPVKLGMLGIYKVRESWAMTGLASKSFAQWMYAIPYKLGKMSHVILYSESCIQRLKQSFIPTCEQNSTIIQNLEHCLKVYKETSK